MSLPNDPLQMDAASQLDEAFYAARPLEPNDRLRLIARLWASLPRDHWAAPSDSDLEELQRRLNEFDTSGIEQTPWKIVRRVAANYPEPFAERPAVRLYSAPRRFDLFTIMIVTAAYAVLLSWMSVLRFAPILSFYVAAFITIVGIGQALLFGGRKPRLASAVAGAAAYFIEWMSFALMEPTWDAEFVALPGLMLAVTMGSLFGYVAGVMVGGVFLIADVLRQRYGKEMNDDSSTATYTPDLEARPTVHPLDDIPSTRY